MEENPGDSVPHSCNAYLTACFQRLNLPKVFKGKLSEKDKGRLGRRDIVSHVFPFPDPSMIFQKKGLSQFALTGRAGGPRGM